MNKINLKTAAKEFVRKNKPNLSPTEMNNLEEMLFDFSTEQCNLYAVGCPKGEQLCVCQEPIEKGWFADAWKCKCGGVYID